MKKCRIPKAIGKHGVPPPWVLSGCMQCKFAVECFLIAGRDYEGEVQAWEEVAKERRGKEIANGDSATITNAAL